MNENPGGTPNPLNPNPMAGPSPVGPAPMPNPTPVSDPMLTPTTNPMANPAPAQPAAGMTTVPVESLAPMNRPMEKAAPTPVPEKKKKTGLIVAIIAALVVLIGGGVAAAMVMMGMNKSDPVMAAMSKIMSDEAPDKVAIDGNIDIVINNKFSPVSEVKIALNSKVIATSAVNESVAKITATLRNIGDLEVEFDEVYAGNGDLYFKIDGAKSALEDSGLLYMLNLAGQTQNGLDCGEDEYCQVEELEDNCSPETNCKLEEISDDEYYILGDGGQNMLSENTIMYFASLAGSVIEVIDGEWLKVSVDDLSNWSDGMTADSNISCITNLVGGINTNSNSAAELYKKYPFVSSTNKDITLESKQYPVYQIIVDSENFAGYVNSIQNSEITESLYSCLGWQDNVKISTDDAAKMVDEMPAIYAEIDDNNNFSRLYLKNTVSDTSGCSCPEGAICDCAPSTDSSVDVTIDLGFSYPENVNVPEPEEYRDFSEVVQEIMSSLYSLPVDN